MLLCVAFLALFVYLSESGKLPSRHALVPFLPIFLWGMITMMGPTTWDPTRRGKPTPRWIQVGNLISVLAGTAIALVLIALAHR